MENTPVCHECHKPLDGESRFWCREHYQHLGTYQIPLTQEVFDRASPPRDQSALFQKLVEIAHGG